jgi:hypothetical protein
MLNCLSAHTNFVKFRLSQPECGRPWLILDLDSDYTSNLHIGVTSSDNILETSEQLLENLTQVVAELKTRLENNK